MRAILGFKESSFFYHSSHICCYLDNIFFISFGASLSCFVLSIYSNCVAVEIWEILKHSLIFSRNSSKNFWWELISIWNKFLEFGSKKLRRVEFIDYCLQGGRSTGRVDSEKDYPNRNLPKTLITNSILSMETLSE